MTWSGQSSERSLMEHPISIALEGLECLLKSVLIEKERGKNGRPLKDALFNLQEGESEAAKASLPPPGPQVGNDLCSVWPWGCRGTPVLPPRTRRARRAKQDTPIVRIGKEKITSETTVVCACWVGPGMSRSSRNRGNVTTVRPSTSRTMGLLGHRGVIRHWAPIGQKDREEAARE
ncbi:hypothetical protein E2C01_014699 [Portunus trituberculatus]|uniref:Uncharacterized protein n=1 Tax=Portunus trituberculatus TaxID=210409 RepID=A0A5B7DL77_PORTR|nr:hypothetical protein [Portunus trituberculatus]